jgi:ATP-dependent DNA helicase RecG
MSNDGLIIEAKLDELLQLKGKENECVEFKTAGNDYSFNDLGAYFSALSNEANLLGKRSSWLVFGISPKGNIIGTNYRHGPKKLMI